MKNLIIVSPSSVNIILVRLINLLNEISAFFEINFY